MSIWVPKLEDYDKVLFNKMKSITVTDKDGNQKPINVTFFTPEPEGLPDRDDFRPVVVIYMYDEVFDTRRLDTTREIVIDDTPTDVTYTNSIVPTKFFYQFSILTDYQQHMNEITYQINALFPKRGYLAMTSPNGEDQLYDFFQRGASNGYTNQFLEYGANQPDRTFRKLYKYVLYTEIEEHVAVNTYKKVQGTVTINLTEMKDS